MVQKARNIFVVLALPILAIFGFLFACLRVLLRAVYRTWGWELAWPPVVADGLEAETDANQFASRQ